VRRGDPQIKEKGATKFTPPIGCPPDDIRPLLKRPHTPQKFRGGNFEKKKAPPLKRGDKTHPKGFPRKNI